MSIYDKAKKLIVTMIGSDENVTEEQIQENIKLVSGMLKLSDPSEQLDEERIFREILSMYNIWIGKETELVDKTEDHFTWLPDKKASIHWSFWNRYKAYLEEKSMTPPIIARLDNLTDKILGYLEDPERKRYWDRRGMVVGQVQSGKTSNYTGLICKAVDAGYKLIIVLAGMSNDLRSQTQYRIDEGFIGLDSESGNGIEAGGKKIGVGALPGFEKLIIQSLTSSSEDGDYKTQKANTISLMPGGNPIILVVKKNTTILRNILKWIRDRGREEPKGEFLLEGIPTLIIDDEADNASVDGKASPRDEDGIPELEKNPTAINGYIRMILKTIKQSSYVGYTATPFANIFIYPNENEKDSNWGEDLYPRSFIINIPAPSNYIGPVKVFGLGKDPETGIECEDGLPIIRKIEDNQDFIPNKHNKRFKPCGIPPTLNKALKTFILSCAARICRKQEREHNSMLIHVTRFTDVQKLVETLIITELNYLQSQLEFGSGRSPSPLIKELEQLWIEDFIPTTETVINRMEEKDFLIEPISWIDVKDHLYEAASKIQVKTVNGTSGDSLEYRKYPNGMSVIAIGGDKLSRGLTLEGLTISYYLRASKMYDTLMQMGRWFGYKPGYLDLCRLYTTDELVNWYQFIAKADEELRKEFDFMAANGGSPKDYGLKVRTHPDGLQITATNKIKHGTLMKVSFEGSLVQTTIFNKNENIIQQNALTVERWIGGLGENFLKNQSRIWKGIKGEEIIEFLEGFIIHRLSSNADPLNLKSYVRKQMVNHKELKEWTVVLKASSKNENTFKISKYEGGLIIRTIDKKSTVEEDYYKIEKGQLITQEDELLDIEEPQRVKALIKTKEDWKDKESKKPEPKLPSGKRIRETRSEQKGLLLIYPIQNPLYPLFDEPIMGFAISFPSSKTAESIEYNVNTTYWKSRYGDD